MLINDQAPSVWYSLTLGLLAAVTCLPLRRPNSRWVLQAPSDQSQRSTLFYKLFSDPMVSRHFTAHGAIAMLEWSIVVAQNTSFEKLYQATFGNSEPFWVKGSTLLGTEFHETATLPDMQFVLGHLNGNAICK